MCGVLGYDAPMAKPLDRKRSLLRHIPFVDSLTSLSAQLGISPYITRAFWIGVSVVMPIWAYISSALPIWALVLVAILALGIVAFALEKILALAAGSRARLELDRDALADEALQLSENIRRLLGQHTPLIRRRSTVQDYEVAQREQEAAIGRLVEEYRYKYDADLWRIIGEADQIIGLTRSDLWDISHGVSHDRDIEERAVFLSKLASWVRYKKPEDTRK